MDELKTLIEEGKQIQQEGAHSSGYSLWRNDVESLVGEMFGDKTARALQVELNSGRRMVRHELDLQDQYQKRMSHVLAFLERLASRGIRQSTSNLNKESKITNRIPVDNLDGTLKQLVGELNSNIDAGNVYASALLLRRIITEAVYIALSKAQKSELLKDANGNDYELDKILGICQSELRIDTRIMSRVRSVKWIGDSANHSFHVKIKDTDVETATTGTRLFLEELNL